MPPCDTNRPLWCEPADDYENLFAEEVAPSPEEIFAAASKARMFCDWLELVAGHRDRHFHLVNVIDGVSRHCKAKGAPIGEKDRDDLLAKLRGVKFSGSTMYWDGAHGYAIASKGFEALEFLIAYWGTSTSGRYRIDKRELRDAYDHAQIFQNLLHNVCLAQAIQCRIEQTAAEEIAHIKRIALGTAP